MARFVVHEHHASRLHWDFRLEMDGVLKSWAVPKGPSTEPGVKRLAVAVEDHPLDYIDFEGAIEEGYGKGTVAIWDRGEYELLDRKEGFISVRLSGTRLTGRYKLVHTGFGKGDGWLLIRGKDQASPGGPPESPRQKRTRAPAKPRRARGKTTG